MIEGQLEKERILADSYDKNGRLRNRIITFRVSPEEAAQIDVAISLTGMLKQDYYASRLLNREISVTGNCKIHRAVFDRLGEVVEELKRINTCQQVNQDLIDNIKLISSVIDRLYMKK